MTSRAAASHAAHQSMYSSLPTTIAPAASDRTTCGSGTVLARALWRASANQLSWRRRLRVWELGGGGYCFARVLALHVHGNAGDRAMQSVLATLADGLACTRSDRSAGAGSQVIMYINVFFDHSSWCSTDNWDV